jgi:glycosyltransferase involved in cell wall biosynthesis
MNIVLTNKAVNIAGGENYVLYLAGGLREHDHNVIIAPLSNSELAAKSKELGFETVEMNYSAKGLDEIPLIFDFANKLRDKKIDLIHTNSNTDRTIGAFASRLMNCKNVAQIHSHFSIKQRSHHSFRNKFIDHFITDSNSSRNQLVSGDKINGNKVSTVHIGIPKEKENISDQTKTELRAEFGIKQNELLIGTVGRLVPFKGHIYLLRAFKDILKEHPNTKLMIVGDGEIQDELLFACNELEITGRVIFPGYRTDIDELLSIFDLYVHPSIDHGGESFPIAVLLALRAGLPVVATKVSDIPFQVLDEFNGFIVDAGNSDQLYGKISRLLNNIDLLNNFALNSSSHFNSNFTLDRMILKIESLYKNILIGDSSKKKRKNSFSPVEFVKQFFDKQREVF